MERTDRMDFLRETSKPRFICKLDISVLQARSRNPQTGGRITGTYTASYACSASARPLRIGFSPAQNRHPNRWLFSRKWERKLTPLSTSDVNPLSILALSTYPTSKRRGITAHSAEVAENFMLATAAGSARRLSLKIVRSGNVLPKFQGSAF